MLRGKSPAGGHHFCYPSVLSCFLACFSRSLFLFLHQKQNLTLLHFCGCHKPTLILLGGRLCINHRPENCPKEGSKIVKSQETAGHDVRLEESGSFRQGDDSGEKR